jgi:hypothetical protein
MMEQLFHENQLNKVLITTIFRWMGQLGYKYEYETHQKMYTSMAMKSPETKKYRKMMASEYLENELCMQQWIQLPLAELVDLEEKKEIKIGNAHHCTDPQTNIEMVELHIDLHPSFHKKISATTKCGGNLRV